MRFRMRSGSARLKQSGPSGSRFLSPRGIFRSHWRAKEPMAAAEQNSWGPRSGAPGSRREKGRPKLRALPGEVWETVSQDSHLGLTCSASLLCSQTVDSIKGNPPLWSQGNRSFLSQPIPVEGKTCSFPEHSPQNHFKDFCVPFQQLIEPGFQLRSVWLRDDFQAAKKMGNKEVYNKIA